MRSASQRIRLTGAQLGLAAAVVGAVTVIPSTAAQAAYSCSNHVVENLDSGTDTVGTWTNNVNMRKGPGTGCGWLTSIPAAATVDLWCYDSGQNINGVSTWSYVAYDNYRGWVSDYYLTNRGSRVHCPPFPGS
ncbi:SH3 domain-containing protein [Phytohabitans sp. LJ34]|uniref:SH3 domain-containing protein n=1 Tax=Phytohabitans sp. LJ34 TaxID=3452217 RepID=UPI003F8B1741